MIRPALLSLACLLLTSFPALSQSLSAPPTQIGAAQLDTARPGDEQLVNEILALLNDAVITRFEARLSLESFNLGKGHVDLRGVRLQNFNLGLRLKPRAAKRLVSLGERYLSNEKTASYFDILRLAVFNDIEFGIHLTELRIAAVKINADDLQVKGLVLHAGATPPQEIAAQGSRDALTSILRRAILHQVQVHAGLEKLSARRLQVQVQQVALHGLRVGLAMRKNDD